MRSSDSRFLLRLAAATAFATLAVVAAALLPQPAFAWGSEGHAFTADVAVRSLPLGPLLNLYTANQVWFETNSAFPDRWRFRDNAEAPRHFLKTENFGGDPAALPADLQDVLKRRSYDQLRQDGIVPWAAARRYALLVDAFRERRWADAMVQSVFLSHYVADAHTPFHATANDDGQLSAPPQNGIGARFAVQVVRRSIRAADLHPGDPLFVPDPATALLAAVQTSYGEAQPILRMDRAAAAAEGDNDYGETYWKSFLPLARPVAIARLEQGGRLLAGLLLSAWYQAGRPTPPPGFIVSDAALPYAPELLPPGRRIDSAYPPLADDVVSAARGAVQTFTLHSRRLERSVPTSILLPRGYDPKAGVRYPVLYLLHGSSGSHDDWNNQTGIAAYVQSLPLIVVMVDAAGDSWYVNSPRGGHWADYFDHELLPYVDRHYLTIPQREGRAIAGNSMGGYGAWYIALSFPRRFCAAASLSGAMDFGAGDLAASGENSDFGRALFGDPSLPAARREYAACQLLPLIAKESRGGAYGGPALSFDDGKDDYLNDQNRHMEQSLMALGIPYEYAEFNGSHDWSYWDTHARDMLNFIRRHLAPPQIPTHVARRGAASSRNGRRQSPPSNRTPPSVPRA